MLSKIYTYEKGNPTPMILIHRGCATLMAVLLVAMFCLPTFGQTISRRQLTSLHLPRATRERLIERFELFVRYEKEQSYDKQFDLLAKEHMATLLHMNVDKESYVKFKEQSQLAVGRLIQLTVNDIKRTSKNPEQLNLSVVAKLQKDKTTYSDSPICIAYLVNGEWRFSLLYVN